MMKRVHYASGSFVTGDRIASALVHYATVLAKAKDADEVEVASMGPGGERESVRLLIGPTSQMMVAALPGDEDLVDAELAEEIESRSALAEAAAAHRPAVVRPDDSFLDPF